MSTTQSLPPPVTWAQRKNVIFLTICVEDCKSPTINMEANKVFFKGTGGTERKDYEYAYNLFKDIDTDKSRSFVRDRNIELILVKKEEGPYWPHLLKEKTKQHWLKVDFSRWKDEDDSDDEEGQNQDLEEMMRQMGGLGGGGGDDRPSLDDLEDEDSDDDDLPDLE
ncbi:prostaglandin E synthase 3-like [Penaeus chinensis]|uniref:prostaglandin E synthase 3-like n=1 Tax=Penaeus chinensis TaxID=139456 RepID=UPI001FB655FB|nr:prostaglandin E synthase 3-like [Penaeus chinensis]